MSRPPFLFGGSSSGSSQSRYLVEFRAGKMTQNGTTVSPVKGRKGTVYLHQSTEDSLMHFCWKDRQTGHIEDDLIIFPDEAEIKSVPQCTTGRVIVLRFKPSSRRFFYWMQEPKDDKDEEYITKINDYINNPPTPGSRGGASSGGLSPASALADLSSINDRDLQGLLNNMSPQQLMSVLGGVPGMSAAQGLASLLGASTHSASSSVSTPAPQTPSTTPAVVSAATSESSLPTAAAIQLSDLQSIISGLTGVNQLKESDVNVDLSSSLTLEALQPLLTNEDFMARVRESLPSGEGSDTPLSNQFASTVQSPQFQQALSTFSSALQSGQLGPLIQQFGLSQECIDAATSGDLENFVKALQKQQTKDSLDAKDGNKKDDKMDDEMALD